MTLGALEDINRFDGYVVDYSAADPFPMFNAIGAAQVSRFRVAVPGRTLDLERDVLDIIPQAI